MRRLNFLFFLLFSFFAFGQNFSLSENSRVSILTCDVGNEVYSLFGHTAIRISDPNTGIDIVYNYGAFDFDTPNFVAKFAKGDLQYFVAVSNFQDFFYQYVAEQRSVYEQELNLTRSQKQKLFDDLNQVVQSDERYYTYKFIDRNCTNMSVDILNRSLGEKAVYKTGDTTKTYRSVLYPYFDRHFYEQLGTSIIFGTKVDQNATLLFLPSEFMQSLESVTIDGKPLAKKAEKLLTYEVPKSNGTWWNNIYTYLGLLLLIGIVRKTRVTFVYFALLGLIGCFFAIAGVYSLHEELAYNYNILLLNPLLLAVIILYYAQKYEWLKRTIFVLWIMLAIYVVVMINKIHFLIVLPMILLNAYLLFGFYRSAKRGATKMR